jgi:hypothetical protein
MHFNSSAARRIGAALALGASWLLAGCNMSDPDWDTDPRSSAFYDRYPIKVKTVQGRQVAVTKECGDWSENLAYSPANRPYPNHGCALQNNIAAMVANPSDFQRPRAMTPSRAANRATAMTIYDALPESAGTIAASSSESASETSDATVSN